jgi:signal transduction histidine kinase
MLPIIIITVLSLACIYFLRRELKNNFTEKSFLSIVNHTFRTPLTSIKWMSDSLQGDLPREQQLEIARNIATSINKVVGVVDTLAGIKDVHSSSSYNLKAVSIREIIETAISKYRTQINEKKITLQVPSLVDLPLLTVDTKKISFVIDALLENAIFYTKENGHITIASTINKRNVTLYVADDGIGLNWHDKYNLFGRFYRGDQAKKMNTDGMGISLYLAHEIMDRHHGSIRAMSHGTNRGSTFLIILPLNS